jgi:CheY-like chemotaxis protein
MKILLVEDSKFLRLATERALARAGYDVSTAIDGQQALGKWRGKGFQTSSYWICYCQR